MRDLFLTTGVWAILTLFPTVGAAVQPFSGTFDLNQGGVTITLELQQDRVGEIHGTFVSSNGARFQVEGEVDDNDSFGVCTNDDGGVYFEAYINNNDLEWRLIGIDEYGEADYNDVTELMFKRRTGGGVKPDNSNPPPAPIRSQPVKTPQPATDSASRSSSAARSGQTFRHPLGFSFWYPESWQVKMDEEEDYYQLVPPGSSSAGNQQGGYYAVLAADLTGTGIQRPDDPQVIAYFEQRLATITPGWQRTGPAQPMPNSAGSGAHLQWQTTVGGTTLIAHAYVCIFETHGLALICVGRNGSLARYESDLQAVFASFSFGAPQIDQQLVGKWHYLATSSLTNNSLYETSYSRVSAVTDNNETLQFFPDGRWANESSSHMIAGSAEVGFMESNDISTTRGRWNANGRILYRLWENSSWQDYKYVLKQTENGLRLILQRGDEGVVYERID